MGLSRVLSAALSARREQGPSGRVVLLRPGDGGRRRLAGRSANAAPFAAAGVEVPSRAGVVSGA